jgi:hypothetical protein
MKLTDKQIVKLVQKTLITMPLPIKKFMVKCNRCKHKCYAGSEQSIKCLYKAGLLIT